VVEAFDAVHRGQSTTVTPPAADRPQVAKRQAEALANAADMRT
jgi:hypothetical protein